MITADPSDNAIWSESQLRDFLGHDDPTIRQWALRRLKQQLAPEELAGVAVEMLGDEDRSVATTAFRIAEVGPTEVLAEHLETLRAFSVREGITRAMRTGALGLLAAIGDESARETMLQEAGERTFEWAEWVTRHPAEFVEAVDEQFDESGLPWEPELFEAILVEGAPELVPLVFEALEEHAEEFALEQKVRLLISTGGGGFWILPEADEMEWAPPEQASPQFRPSYELVDLERQREQTEAQIEARENEDWEAFAEQSLAALDDMVEAGIADDIEARTLDWTIACGAELAERPSFAEPRLRARLALGLEMTARLVYGLERVLADEERDLADKLAVFPHVMGAERDRFMDVLEASWSETADDPEARERVAETIHEWLADSDDGDRFVDKLGMAADLEGLDVSNELETFVDDLVLGDADAWLRGGEYELLEELLLEYPAIFRDRAEALLFEGDEGTRLFMLSALGKTNAEWASDLLLERLEDLLQTDEANDVWDAIMELGDPRALDRAVEEWRPGEALIAECAGRLARLAGEFDELDEALRETYHEQLRRHQELYDRARGMFEEGPSLAATDADEPVRLPLKCTECGRTYTYHLDQVFLDMEVASDEDVEMRQAYVPDRIISCKNCGAVDAYEVTAQGAMSLLGHQVEMMDRMDRGAIEEIRTGKMVPANFTLWDGTTIRKPSEAIAHLRELADDEPDNSEAWLRLGNFCGRFGEYDQAVEAWREAVEVDDREVEAAYQLADALWDEEPDEAADFALMALRRLPNGIVHSEDRLPMAHELIDMLRALVTGGGFPTEMVAVSQMRDMGTVDLNGVDLRRITRWDRLAEMFARGAFSQVGFGMDPPETVGRLEKVIESDQPLGGGRRAGSPVESILQSSGAGSSGQQTYVKSEEEDVGRNDPCPCGSGRKYKKCCLRKE